METGHLRCLIRGGNWNNGGNAGVFNSNLNNPRSNANGNIGGRSAFRLLNANLGRWFCAARGLWPTGVQQEVQTKRGLFPFPLRQGGKKFVLPWRRKRHTRLGEIIG